MRGLRFSSSHPEEQSDEGFLYNNNNIYIVYEY